MKRVLLFLVFTIISTACEIDIRGLGFAENILVTINGVKVEDRKCPKSAGDKLPMHMAVWKLNFKEKNLMLLMKKNIYNPHPPISISNEDTILEILFEKLVSKISHKKEDREKILHRLKNTFEKEIEIYSKAQGQTMVERLNMLNWPAVEHKLNNLAKKMSPHRNLYGKNLDLSSVKNLKNKYLEIYLLNRDTPNKTFIFLDRYDKITEKLTVQAPINEPIVLFLHDKKTNEPIFVNYLNPGENSVEEQRENKELVSFEFDRLMVECMHEGQEKRNCYYFDVVEHHVPSKDFFLQYITSTIPKEVKNLPLNKKMPAIKKHFFDTMVDIVMKNK